MDRHFFHSGPTNIRYYGFAICSLDQQLPVGMVFSISSHTVHTLQVWAVVWILCVGESAGPNRRTTVVLLSGYKYPVHSHPAKWNADRRLIFLISSALLF